MSANNSGSGGVRNLRAMFENKASDQSAPASSPIRDRSPNNPDPATNNRPLNKVRASFVPVDRPGEIGHIPHLGSRKASDVSSTQETKDSDTSTPEGLEPPKPDAMDVKQDTKSFSPHTSNKSIDGGLGSILKGSAFEPGTPTKNGATTKTSIQKHNSSEAQNKTSVPAARKKAVATQKPNGNTPVEPSAHKKTQPVVEKSQAVLTLKPKTNGDTPSTKSLAGKEPLPKTSTTSPSIPKQKSPISSASPAVQRIRGGPAKIVGVMESAKKAEEDRKAMAQKSNEGSEKKPEVEQNPKEKVNGATKPKSNVESEPVKKTNSEQTSKLKFTVKSEPVKKVEKDLVSKPKVNGVKKEAATNASSKPAPKTSGGPVRLPSAVTAPTAASAAKVETHVGTASSLERTTSKRSSNAPLRQAKAATSTTASQLAKKASRASLVQEEERPKSRASVSKPDESFLARMTKATASTASKAHDKLDVSSPPRQRATSLNKQSIATKGKPPRMSLKGKEPEKNSANKTVGSKKPVSDSVPESDSLDIFRADSEHQEDVAQSSGSGDSVNAPTKDNLNVDEPVTIDTTVPNQQAENGLTSSTAA